MSHLTFSPNFNKVLYPDSPFLPPIKTQSLWHILHLTSIEGYHPNVAIAHEVRLITEDHCQFLDTQKDWIAEKFNISEDETNLYYLGLFIPPTLLLAADMVGWIPPEKILETLIFPKELFDGAREYISQHLSLASRLIDTDSLEPMISAEPIYYHCGLEVYSDNIWYLTGMEASNYLYSSLARLFGDET